MKLNILRFKKSCSLIDLLCSLFFFQFMNTLISNKIQLIHLSVLNVTVLTNKSNGKLIFFSNIHINLPDIPIEWFGSCKVMKIKFFEISIIFNTQCWIRYHLVSDWNWQIYSTWNDLKWCKAGHSTWNISWTWEPDRCFHPSIFVVPIYISYSIQI